MLAPSSFMSDSPAFAIYAHSFFEFAPVVSYMLVENQNGSCGGDPEPV